MREYSKKQQRMKQHLATQSIKETSRIFTSGVKEESDCICTCCNCLMYRKTVLQLRPPTTPKHQQNLQQCVCTSSKNEVWICRTCDHELRLHPFHMPVLASYPAWVRGYENQLPPKLHIEQCACGCSLPHAEQVDPSSHTS